MIKNVATLLKALIEEETRKLDEFDIKHGPTIGKMYEGLTADILNKAIPPQINLRLTSGVIHDGLGNMTGEIDCMLVEGEGEEIPYTQAYKWHIKDVIAVFEIKKNLYSKELKDSFLHLRQILDTYGSYVDCGEGSKTFDISSSLRAFAETTGKIAPSRAEVEKLPFEQQIIYHTLITEQISPIRIVLGYHGFKSENNLRNALIKFLGENLMSQGFGVGSFPQLIISGQYSLVKMNGHPYSAPMTSDYWGFYGSSRTNPILLILEFIWTRLSRMYGISGLWGDDLKSENFILLLSGRIKKIGAKFGWEYNYPKTDKSILSSEPADIDWEPTYVTSAQFTIFNRLCHGELERIDDPFLIEFLEKEKINPNVFFKELTKTGLVALDGNALNLTTECCQCVILPNGKFAVAENNSGRLTNWMIQFIDKHKNP